MIQTHIILKIKDHNILLGDCKPWDKLFRPEKTVKVDKIRYVASSNPHAVPKKLPPKIFTEENFSNLVSYLYYTYWKQSMKKYERNLFCGPESIWRSYRDWLLNLNVICYSSSLFSYFRSQSHEQTLKIAEKALHVYVCLHTPWCSSNNLL